MIEKLNFLVRKRDENELIKLIRNNPQTLEKTNDEGVTGYMLIAYGWLKNALEVADSLKQNYTYHEAIIANKVSIVKALVNKYPTIVNQFSPDGFPPLALAAFFDSTDVAKYLVNNGGDPSLLAKGAMKVNALHSAVARNNYELCLLFLQYGVDPNIPQAGNVTPLHSAVHRGNVGLVKLLIEGGAKPFTKMDNGETPMTIARRENHLKIIEILKAAQ